MTVGRLWRELSQARRGSARCEGRKADWGNDPRRNQVRQIVADGRYYIRGGCRDLLRYPFRLSQGD
nr:DUF2285 domain-containing protein [Gluconacetobacter azotocaptans]